VAVTSYSKDEEREADYYGLLYAYKAGYDVEKGIHFYEKLAIAYPQSLNKNFAVSHPVTAERIVRLKKLVKKIKIKEKKLEKKIALIKVPEEKWWLIKETVSKYFPELQVEDREKGELITKWKVTDKCWAGLLYGGFVPCKKERAIVKVKSLNPFEIVVKVEIKKASGWSNYKRWEFKGYDADLEIRIINELHNKMLLTNKIY